MNTAEKENNFYHIVDAQVNHILEENDESLVLPFLLCGILLAFSCMFFLETLYAPEWLQAISKYNLIIGSVVFLFLWESLFWSKRIEPASNRIKEALLEKVRTFWLTCQVMVIVYTILLVSLMFVCVLVALIFGLLLLAYYFYAPLAIVLGFLGLNAMKAFTIKKPVPVVKKKKKR